VPGREILSAMNTTLVAGIISASLFAAVLTGMRVRNLLPGHHLGDESRDTVKMATGLVATMSALLLGLLISSAKDNFDVRRTEVGQMAAKIAFLDRLLVLYGPEAQPIRVRFHDTIEQAVKRIWPADAHTPPQLAPNTTTQESLYFDIQHLAPHDEVQKGLKSQAAAIAMELGQLRMLLHTQSVSTVPNPLLIMVVFWLVVIFFSFSLLAPSNATARVALLISALSVSGAIYLILEMDRPFGGLLHISSEPILRAMENISR
jgi:hypothetical protein